MPSSRRLVPALFTLGLHAALAGVLLLVPQRGTSAADAVYQVSLANFAAPAVAASRTPSPGEAAARARPCPVPPAPVEQSVAPAAQVPEEKIISVKKAAESEKKSPAPKTAARPQPAKPPARESAGPETESAPARTLSPDGQAGSGAGTGGGPRDIDGFAAYSADTVDQIPAVERKVMPDYPLKARRLDLQGRVVVRLVVDALGEPRACAVHEASPPGYFEDAALDAARRTRFIPGKLRGRAVNTVVLLPFTFSLR